VLFSHFLVEKHAVFDYNVYMDYVRRNITERVAEALADTPIAFIHGARQTGKSTLAQAIASKYHPARYITFDNITVLTAARRDPEGFLSSLGAPVVLDEVQRVPELFVAIKSVVDQDRIPGQYLLTGSTNVLLLPRLSETLVGRMELIALWPFSQGELEGFKEDFIDSLFSQNPLNQGMAVALEREEIIDRLLCGGYPESVNRKTARRRVAWFESYVNTIVYRELRDIANIDYLAEIPRLLRLLAARVSGQLNYTELSNALGIPQTTIKRYLSLLEITYLFCPVPAWSSGLSKRLIKRPKIFLNDTGLVSHLLAADRQRFQREPTLLGPLLENFVVMELRKQITWSRTKTQLFHFRTRKGQEVDILLEDPSGQLVGIEVKATSTIREHDLKGLLYLQDLVGKRLHRGIVLYTGKERVPLGKDLLALPVATLWQKQG